VTPALCPDVATAAGELGVPVVMGVFTPSEIVAAMRAGATAVKLFPASTVGPDYVAAIRQPLPDLPLVVVGGVRVEDAAAYLRAGALAVGVGSPLIGDACAGGSLDELRQRARALVTEARGVFA
jgi:2-dehydro-3-deoxyphosphogluconate aldolase/(4S)-4-hydroxy-2-oxoglutarate aldolase